MAADLDTLITADIPEGRQNLLDSFTNLERVAEYCENNYYQCENKGRRWKRPRVTPRKAWLPWLTRSTLWPTISYKLWICKPINWARWKVKSTILRKRSEYTRKKSPVEKLES